MLAIQVRMMLTEALRPFRVAFLGNLVESRIIRLVIFQVCVFTSANFAL